MARRRKYPPKPKRWLGLATILKQHRTELGYTQAECARILKWYPPHTAHTFYGQVEAGFVLPKSDAHRLALGRFLGWIRSDDDVEGRDRTRKWFAGDGPRSTPAHIEAEQRRKRVAHVFKKR